MDSDFYNDPLLLSFQIYTQNTQIYQHLYKYVSQKDAHVKNKEMFNNNKDWKLLKIHFTIMKLYYNYIKGWNYFILSYFLQELKLQAVVVTPVS